MINEKYKQYANDVLNGNIIANRYVKLACERFLSWFNREDIEFREDKVARVIRFINLLKHFTGKHNGKPFILLPWQEFIVANIFGFYYKNTSKRVIRNAYIEVGRKNGKSALIAAITLYGLIADGESGSECDVLANSRQQAHILYDMACAFAKGLDPKGKLLKPQRDRIKFDKTNSFCQVMSSDSTRSDGFNSHFFCEDELHEAKDSKLWDVLKSSQGMRENPLAIAITSAGFNKHSFCYQMRETCIEILEGVKEDDSQFALIYSLDNEDDWKDEKNWIKSNPSLGQTVQYDYLKEQVTQATNNSALEVGVVTKNFGRWCETQEVFLPNEKIIECSDNIDLNDWKDKEIQLYLGLDLSAVQDVTALSMMWEYEGLYYFKSILYLPEDTLKTSPNKEKYKLWKNKGYLKVTPGNVVDYDYILNEIMNISKDFSINTISYDSWQSTYLIIKLTENGMPCKPYSQTAGAMNKPVKEFARRVLSNQLVIDNNPMVRWMWSNARQKEDWNNNAKLVKDSVENKIDACVAMMMALGGFFNNEHYNNEIMTV